MYTISTYKKVESEHFTLCYTSNFILLQRDLEVTAQLEKKNNNTYEILLDIGSVLAPIPSISNASGVYLSEEELM